MSSIKKFFTDLWNKVWPKFQLLLKTEKYFAIALLVGAVLTVFGTLLIIPSLVISSSRGVLIFFMLLSYFLAVVAFVAAWLVKKFMYKPLLPIKPITGNIPGQVSGLHVDFE